MKFEEGAQMEKTIKDKVLEKIHSPIKYQKRWEDCICGNYIVHSIECRRNHTKNRLKKYAPLKKAERIQLRKEHRCITCGKKVQPKILYRQYCEYHRKREIENRNEKWLAKNISY